MCYEPEHNIWLVAGTLRCESPGLQKSASVGPRNGQILYQRASQCRWNADGSPPTQTRKSRRENPWSESDLTDQSCMPHGIGGRSLTQSARHARAQTVCKSQSFESVCKGMTLTLTTLVSHYLRWHGRRTACSDLHLQGS